MKTVGIFQLIIFSTILFGCYYDREAVLYPPQPLTNCDTSTITYSQTIVPIIDQYCYSCHSSSNSQSAGGGYNLEGYNNIKPYAIPNGTLIKSINFTPGVNPMPNGGVKIPDCDILKIQLWINAGSPNN